MTDNEKFEVVLKYRNLSEDILKEAKENDSISEELKKAAKALGSKALSSMWFFDNLYDITDGELVELEQALIELNSIEGTDYKI